MPTLGHAAVVIGLGLTAYAVVAFILAARAADDRLVRSGRRAVIGSLAAAAVACLAMVVSLLAHDFSVRYVVENNATTTPPFIGAISLWAALEGSILFWTLLATAWASAVLWWHRSRHRQLVPWVGATLAAVNLFFFAVMTWPGNPFTRITPVAAEGAGPNALLQNHPFMALHPPLLYLGYTGLAVPFAFGVAALVTGRLDEAWLRIVRRWTLVPWTFLTLGIVAGAWWSYEVLGWGGYWAWDPVENAALLPWLTATAFLHSAMVAERRGGLRIWTSALVVATFTLTLTGTFITRSGIIDSVHSFTESPIGPWFLVAVIGSLAVGVGLVVWRLPALAGMGRPSGTVSRESAFLLNNVLFLALTFAVLFGTFLPLMWESTTAERISVGRPWFDAVAVPMFVALLFLMGVGPALPWGTASVATLRERFGLPLLAAVTVGVLAVLVGLREAGPLGVLALAVFSGGVMVDEVVRGARSRGRTRGEPAWTATWRLSTRNRRRYGGYGVHVGVLVMAVGVAVSSGLSADRTIRLAPGESASVAGYTLTHDRLVVEPLADDRRVTETRAELTYDGAQSGALATASRDYPNSTAAIATPGVRTSLAEDLYVTLLAADPATGAVSLQVLVRPLVVWIWIGGGIVGLFAVFAMWPDRRPRAAEVPVGGHAAPRAPAAVGSSVDGA
jgi:cytochrome c-type biogenesis protein CcmF